MVEAHLVHSQDVCLLVAFGHRLLSGPIHVILCFLLSIASPSKIAGGNVVWQLLIDVGGRTSGLMYSLLDAASWHNML